METELAKPESVRSRKDILAVLAESETTKSSIKDFLSSRGIKEGTFYYWRKKYGEKQPPPTAAKTAGFAKLEVKPVVLRENQKLFAEVGNIRIYQPVPAGYLKTLAGRYLVLLLVTEESFICIDKRPICGKGLIRSAVSSLANWANGSLMGLPLFLLVVPARI